MENILLTIDHREPIWLGVAFVFGLLVRLAGLPPMIGFLAAGFFLNALGAEGGYFLEELADFGITLLLFTIGLKLRISHLLKPEIWAVSTIHMLITVLAFAGLLLLIGGFGLAMFEGLDWNSALVVGFALSFSSTVFAVKTLDSNNAAGSRYGRIAIGVLIVQDIAAVAFLAVTAGKPPSLWALALLGLIPLRRPLLLVLERIGHGELLVLMGFVLALGGAELFELVSLKGDLGALAAGALLTGHPRADELAKSLLNFKELFLVGFFLTIGLTGIPTLETVLVALLLLILVPLKVALFFRLFTGFRLMASTSVSAAFTLANYSEFGLIVAAIAAGSGMVGNEWLLVIAIALSFSFITGAPLNSYAGRFFERYSVPLKSYESKHRLKEDEAIDIEDTQIVVFGMGRIGTGAYDALDARLPGSVVGIDFDEVVVGDHRAAGRNVLHGNAANSEFWTLLRPARTRIEYVLLSMSNHQAQLDSINQLKLRGYQGRIAATAKYPHHREELRKHGADIAYNIYDGAGVGFAELALSKFGI